MREKYLVVLFIVLILSTILQSTFLIIQIQEAKHEPVIGHSTSGYVKFCMNREPEVYGHNCPSSSSEGVNFTCWLNASDPDGFNLTYSAISTNMENMPYNVTENGTYTFFTYSGNVSNYTDFVGIHNLYLIVTDNSGCTNSGHSMYIEFEVSDVNDPPILIQPLPDILMPKDTSVTMFNLDDYFSDPEGQILTYNNSPTPSILLTILGTNRVRAFATSCSTETVYFTATDPENLSVTSNQITIEVDCSGLGSGEEEPSEGAETTSSGGGGGSPSTCISDWVCNPWSSCVENGTQKRLCIDNNACSAQYASYWMTRDCTYIPIPECIEYWTCQDWQECLPDNTQIRDCSDTNGCGLEDNKPDTVQSCVYVATCTDNIQNQGETGIDCGGPCLPCKNIETPGIIKEAKTLISSLLLLIIFIILTLIIIYKYFHKQINTSIVRFLLNITEKKPKRILLSNRDKEDLLDRILKAEKGIDNNNLKNKTVLAATISRDYFSRIFRIPITFTRKDLENHMKELHIKQPLNDIYRGVFEKSVLLETGKMHLYKLDILTFLEEIRELIHLTSKFNSKDLHKEIKELEIEKDEKDTSIIRKHMYNIYIAMHFDRPEIVKGKYADIIQAYDGLSESKKSKFYNDISRLFSEIKYFLETYK